MPKLRFTLYVAGETARTQLAIANLRRLAEARWRGRYQLVVIDVRADPGRAEAQRILTTPTLVKEAPAPSRRVTGDLSDTEAVLLALSLPDDEP